ncbi:MAG: hypothetical protein K0S74_241 [Chlamydiales bacterium]|jgi:CRP-like cAMP-binding protein|nr:hypothetical protein [Chlamydiales bacterium]
MEQPISNNTETSENQEKAKELVKLIRSAHFFKGFTGEELKSLIQIATPNYYSAGDVIINKGEVASSFYILLQGKVEVFIFKKDNSKVKTFIDEGYAFGEMALIEKTVRNATCVATTPVTILEIGGQALSSGNPIVIAKIYTRLSEILARRLSKMTVLIEEFFDQQLQTIAPGTSPSLENKDTAKVEEAPSSDSISSSKAKEPSSILEKPATISPVNAETQALSSQPVAETPVVESKDSKSQDTIHSNKTSNPTQETKAVESEIKTETTQTSEEGASSTSLKKPKSLADIKAAAAAKNAPPIEKEEKPAGPIKRDLTQKQKEKKQESSKEPPVEEKIEELNPMSSVTGRAETYNTEVKTPDDYEAIQRKINSRLEFFAAKIPSVISDMIVNKLFGYLTGGKLAKVNPYKIWDPKLFSEGSTRLLRALHMVVVSSIGNEAYKEAFHELPLTHRVVGFPQLGCVGTFLGSEEDIDRYLIGHDLKTAIQLDMEIPIDRLWGGKDCIEFLTHTIKDVRPETLFLVFDDYEGCNTKLIRKKFPDHQIITIVYGTGFNKEDIATIFTQPEQELTDFGFLKQRKDYTETGFYSGQTFFLPDFSLLYTSVDKCGDIGHLFGMITILAKLGPDYSGITWGSKGGAEGAVKAARAMYGIKGAQSASDIAAAINWADNN